MVITCKQTQKMERDSIFILIEIKSFSPPVQVKTDGKFTFSSLKQIYTDFTYLSITWHSSISSQHLLRCQVIRFDFYPLKVYVYYPPTFPPSFLARVRCTHVLIFSPPSLENMLTRNMLYRLQLPTYFLLNIFVN